MASRLARIHRIDEIGGFDDFGAAAHIIAQICHWQKRRIFAFSRPGDVAAQQFARSLGVEWAGASGDSAPRLLDAASFLPIARQAHIHTSTKIYRLDQANEAIRDLREGRLQGAAVLVPT